VGEQGERPPRTPTPVQSRGHSGRGAGRAVALGGVGEVIGSQSVAAVFAVCAGLVMSLVRYDDLLEALKTTGLNQSDEIRLEHR
jgi:hypothetical protein